MGENELFFFTFWICVHRWCCYTVTRFFCAYDVCFPHHSQHPKRERDDGDRGSAKWPFSSLPIPTSWEELRPFLIPPKGERGIQSQLGQKGSKRGEGGGLVGRGEGEEELLSTSIVPSPPFLLSQTEEEEGLSS